MWKKIEENCYKYLPMLARIAHILPTSSADVEQTFSNVKLFKNLLRNRLSESSLESLILVDEELRIKKKLTVSEDMLQSFDLVMEKQNKRSYDAISKEENSKIQHKNSL